MNRMVGRVAIVTGADHPLGAACVARLCAEGAEVVAAGSNPVKGAAATCRHDGTTPDSWRALIAEARQRGGPAVLVNADLRFFAKPFTDTSLEEVQSLSASGVVAPWLGMKEVIPAIRARGGGYVVNVISVLGRVAHSDAAIFSALSGGLRVATKSAALECARQEPRVIVNAVIVGAVPLPTAVGTQ
ncbi:MAG: SDR family NAD(P)-dependent oxidoreductase, partial [Alphaproteobacteria bacterium]|nr:SDR family NAD(P)-dependent oxidoreductase [Alphaproteobacteria bacterium]